jgi:hypothetical protein
MVRLKTVGVGDEVEKEKDISAGREAEEFEEDGLEGEGGRSEHGMPYVPGSEGFGFISGEISAYIACQRKVNPLVLKAVRNVVCA